MAFETLHHMKNKKVGKLGFITMKLDISKGIRPGWVGFLIFVDEDGLPQKMNQSDFWMH